MWTVTSKTKKAIPGLAKILLGIILLGTIIFAVHVQHVKRGELILTLDTKLTLPTDSGLITLDISSTWQKISAVTDGDQIQGIWEIPAERGSKTIEGYFYLNLLPSHPKPEHQIVEIARRNRWMNRIDGLRIQKYTDGDPAYPMFDAIAIFLDSAERMVLSLKLIYLPNGSTLALSMITPGSRQIRTGHWLDHLGGTVTFLPAGPRQQVNSQPYHFPFKTQNTGAI